MCFWLGKKEQYLVERAQNHFSCFSCKNCSKRSSNAFLFPCAFLQPRQHPFILPPMHVQCGEHYTETHNSQGT